MALCVETDKSVEFAHYCEVYISLFGVCGLGESINFVLCEESAENVVFSPSAASDVIMF